MESEVSATTQNCFSGKVLYFCTQSSHQRNFKLSQEYKAGKSRPSSPITAKGSTSQMMPQMGNFTDMSKATLVPNGCYSVKKRKKKAHGNSCEEEYFIGMSLARKTIVKACFP